MKEFFVGYLRMPEALHKRYRLIVPSLILGGLVVALSISAMQQSSGQGQWDPSVTKHVQGLLTIAPYPVLHTAEGQSILLVRAGKASAIEYVESFAGQHVAIQGTPIERGGWQMMEVIRPADVQAWAPDMPLQAPSSVPVGDVTLYGEIVDSKCFLGVMKPGAGKVHRARAAMCLTGTFRC